MKTPDEKTVHKVMQWLAYAEEDLRLAAHAMGMPPAECPARLVAYHAQQCAEKCLKAYLVYHGVDFPYTHNISTLLELCSECGDWPVNLREAEELTDYAVTTRYPGDAAEVSEAETRRAVELAQQVSAQVRAALHEFGMELE